MQNKKKLKIFLRELKVEDVTRRYVNWMNDYNVVKFTEQRFKRHTYKDVKNFVREKNKSKNNFLFGIFIDKSLNKNSYSKKNIEHVGNIKLGPINFTHKFAYISYFIGETKYWGMGITTLAIKKIINIASNKYKLKKLETGCYSINIGSKKVLEKNKFIREGILKSHIICKGRRCDHFIYGLKL